MKHNLRLIGVCAIILACAAPVAFANSTDIYKWVDRNGVVHYGDQIPPQYARQKREVINHQGMVVDVLPAQKTPAELATELAAQHKRREAAARQAKQKQRDQMLLNAYRSVADIEHARNGHLGAIAARMNITHGAIDALKEQFEDLRQRAGKNKPKPKLAKQIASVKEKLTANQQALSDEKAKQGEIKGQFASDIARFKELRTKAHQP